MNNKNAVLILNYNSTENTEQCIKELLKIKNIAILVVDNDSKDRPMSTFKKLSTRIYTIQNTKNLGFAAGNNVGIRYLLDKGKEKILLLNSDTKFKYQDISKLFINNEDIVGPVLLYEKDKRHIYDLGGHINKFLGRAYHEEVNSAENIKETFPDYVSGAAMLVKSSVFSTIGFMDEDYFLYYEDSDFCLRAKKAGLIVKIDPNVIIYHELSHTIGRKSFFGLYQNLRSNIIFIFKNINWPFKFVALIYWGMLFFKVLMKYQISMIKSR